MAWQVLLLVLRQAVCVLLLQWLHEALLAL
jgi:hypothetical protein